MSIQSALDSLMDNYQDFNIGTWKQNFYQDKSDEQVKRPVAKYSYALMRAGLNVFIQHHFADNLNSLAFDRDSFCTDVRRYVPEVWSYYLEEAQSTLGSASIRQLLELEFIDWGPGCQNHVGAWHRIDFREFELDVLLQISNSKCRLGGFEGFCFLFNDKETAFQLPGDHSTTCQLMGSIHLQTVIDEILDALGISPESAISAIKWQMRGR